MFIPVNLNTATDEDILSIPGAGARMVREFKEYRPWKTKEQFDKEISKYVGPEGNRPALALRRHRLMPRRADLRLRSGHPEPCRGVKPGGYACVHS